MITSYKDVQSSVISLALQHNPGTARITEDSLLSEFDSIDAVEFTFALEGIFDIIIADANWALCRTVGDLADYVATALGIEKAFVEPT